MVKLAKPTIRGTSRPRREMSLRFNALLYRQPTTHMLADRSIEVEHIFVLPTTYTGDEKIAVPPTMKTRPKTQAGILKTGKKKKYI